MSIAGKRVGLKHDDLGDGETTRSGLFMEAVRIIKEMRAEDERNGKSGVDVRPRYAVWENVPGAYSSNGGDDFRAVLEELCKVKDPNISIPKPKKWEHAGSIVGDGYSICWRTLDAQYWGVPQRRKRIYLVADFGSECSSEILFVEEGLRGNTETGRKTREDPARDTESGIRATDCKGIITFEPGIASRDGGHVYDGIAGTLRANAGDNQLATVIAIENHPADSRMGTGGGNVPMVLLNDQGGASINVEDGEKAPTLRAESHQHEPVICLQGNGIDRADTAGCNGRGWCEDVSYTLNTIDRPAVCVLDRTFYNQGENALYEPQVYEDGTVPTMVAKGPSAVCYQQKTGPLMANTHLGSYSGQDAYSDMIIVDSVIAMNERQYALTATENVANTLTGTDYKGTQLIAIPHEPQYIVRRLTPLECCRLQGFPDWWCSGLETENPTEEDIAFWGDVFETHRVAITGASKQKTDKQIINWLQDPYSDSAIYKMWGNGIALPNAVFVLNQLIDRQ